MAQKYLSVEEAAKILGVTPDKLNELRERRKVFGIRDGSSWKFKEQDIQRALEDMKSGAPDSGMYSLSIEEEPDSVLLSEVELGEGSGMSGTVIGKPGTMSPVDSDIELFTDDDKQAAGSSAQSDSDVTLVPDPGTSAGDSGVKLVAAGDVLKPDSSKDLSNTIELELSDLALEDDDTDLPFDLGGSGMGDSKIKKAAEDAAKAGQSTSSTGSSGPGSDLTLDSLDMHDDELGLASSGLSLEDISAGKDDSPSSNTGSGLGSSPVDSAIELGGSEFEDDDLVLGSHTGSDISDSGISLGSPADSGISLEDPLELGGEIVVDEGSGTTGELTADDEFLLTPAVEMGEEDLDESGSQVIALDTEGDFDDSAATMLGGEMGGTPGMLEEDPFAAVAGGPALDTLGMGGMGMGAPATAPVQQVVAREAPFSVLNIISLAACLLFLTLTGMMMFDLMRNMWSWDGPYSFNSSLMDGIIGLFEQ